MYIHTYNGYYHYDFWHKFSCQIITSLCNKYWQGGFTPPLLVLPFVSNHEPSKLYAFCCNNGSYLYNTYKITFTNLQVNTSVLPFLVFAIGQGSVSDENSL